MDWLKIHTTDFEHHLSLQGNSSCPANIHSSIDDDNYLKLKKIVDIAEKYQAEKIYLDLSISDISLEKILEKMREMFFYASMKKIELLGPWSEEAEWREFLARPVYFKRFEVIDVLSMIKIEDIGPMLNSISEAIKTLERDLWPLKNKILINISEYQEELKAASNQPNLPDWVRATTNGDRTFYHQGTSLTPALVHELTHLFIAQRELRLPAWFVEGLCEWTQDHKIDIDLLKKSIREKNLFEALVKMEAENLLLIDLDQNLPFRNPYYLQAKAFVGYLQTKMGKDLFDQFLNSCEIITFEEALHRHKVELKKEFMLFCEAYS